MLQWISLYIEVELLVQGTGVQLTLVLLPGEFHGRRRHKESDRTKRRTLQDILLMGFPGGKESTCQCRRPKGLRFHLWAGTISWSRNGTPFQYSCLENSMSRGAWWAKSMGPQSQTWLRDWARAHRTLWECSVPLSHVSDIWWHCLKRPMRKPTVKLTGSSNLCYLSKPTVIIIGMHYFVCLPIADHRVSDSLIRWTVCYKGFQTYVLDSKII